ncbi:MAG: response regulator transcription factor [Bacteroidetes bacterium]|nr:MAG: response regulator transcription factor [Bacteroidota bacterium]
MINIVIADDHKMFLDGLSSLLNGFVHIKIMGDAANGDEVLKLLDKHTVDIVITDISMPGMDGMKLTKEIRKNYPHIKILALSMHNQGSITSTMLKNGISGYVLKDAGKEELLNAIKALSAGGTYFSEEVKSALMESMISGKKTTSGNSLIELSERETEVLKLIAEEYTQQQIADKLFISPHTVIFHRRKLLFKFDAKNTAGLIKAAMENGFL